MSWVSKVPIVEIWSVQSVPVHPIKSLILGKPNNFLDSFDCMGKLNTLGHGQVVDSY